MPTRSSDPAGKIDEIDGTCTVEWVLPRVLAKEQIQMMHDRLKTWCKMATAMDWPPKNIQIRVTLGAWFRQISQT